MPALRAKSIQAQAAEGMGLDPPCPKTCSSIFISAGLIFPCMLFSNFLGRRKAEIFHIAGMSLHDLRGSVNISHVKACI